MQFDAHCRVICPHCQGRMNGVVNHEQMPKGILHVVFACGDCGKSIPAIIRCRPSKEG